ncbi:SDR family NAD(P)-dependent oxidoreductase [Pseudomonas gingeri]|uniref:SDR family NAD(P)-dependent oxidoreductase n=2 Tax=Pseudomonas gingeri TaxID=117681 RepID=A0A7Y7XHJ6_9PSED|nr:SDR family NAD(P)-dependent oxidoreductase [Pseudomonas gingeri]NWC00029.1 SDR family NAD(P)-dependent oxidoreductase [Pseudomonas gingeri]
MNTQRMALVLGATGGIGGEVARQLVARGWRVKALQRSPEALKKPDSRFEWLRGDAMVEQDVVSAAQGASLIVHAVNPAGYHNWAGLVLPMIDNSIAAARASGARILLPGTVYNYGPDVFPVWSEAAAQHPTTRKGEIRVELERRLKVVAGEGVRTLIVRSGDYFGSSHANTWFASCLVKPGRRLRAIRYPGESGIGHQWAYMPDVAQTMICLLEQEERLATFATFNMRGHWDADGTRMVSTLLRMGGYANVAVRSFPWWAIPLIAPFSEMLREVKEMRYLWQQPLRMDNQQLLSVLGHEPHTPWDEAVRATLVAMGCVSGAGKR